MLYDCLQAKIEADLQLQRLKVSSMQTDLENSEAVQRDFVKLSQSLQVTVAIVTLWDAIILSLLLWYSGICRYRSRGITVS